MARPKADQLTARELEIMHVFWDRGQATVGQVRQGLARSGRQLAYTTVATLVKILADKGFLEQVNHQRPFIYRPRQSYEEVSRSLLGDFLHRVFRGSREQLLVRLVEDKPLSAKERQLLQELLQKRSRRK